MRKAACLAVAMLATALALPGAAAANESLTLVLNWVPTADHSPYYYALQQGWYAKAGIDLVIETGKGSGITAQRVGAGTADIGIAELATALVAKSKDGAAGRVFAEIAVGDRRPNGAEHQRRGVNLVPLADRRQYLSEPEREAVGHVGVVVKTLQHDIAIATVAL